MNRNFNGVLRYNKINPRYFTDDSGRAVFLTGSHTWAVMQDMWLEDKPRKNMDYDGFLQMMEDNGHNFLRFWQWMQVKNAPWSDTPTVFDPQPFARTGPGMAKDGLPRFNLSVWNEAYFTRLRERVEKAGNKGIYIGIMFFDAWSIKNAYSDHVNPWLYHPMHPDNNINSITDNPVLENGRAWNYYSLNCPQLLKWQKNYIMKVVDTLNDLDNVLFEIANEIPYTKEAMDWQNFLCDFIHEYESGKPKQHPVGITPEGMCHDNTEMFASKGDWISPGIGRLYEYRYNPPAAVGSKVIISDTDHLWGHGCDVAWIWKSFTRGMNVIFMDSWEPIPGCSEKYNEGAISKNQRYYYAWDPIRRNLGYVRNFAMRMDLNHCTPHNELCTSTYCLANPGTEYLCYLPTGGNEGLDLYEAKGMFDIEWFNPYTGNTIKGGGVMEEEWAGNVQKNSITGGNKYRLITPFDTGEPSILYLALR